MSSSIYDQNNASHQVDCNPLGQKAINMNEISLSKDRQSSSKRASSKKQPLKSTSKLKQDKL